MRPPEQARRLRALLRHLPSTRSLAADDWRRSGLRPVNQPLGRIAGAARLVDRCLDTGLVRGLLDDLARGGAGLLVERLTVRPHIGTGRARAIAVNAVLPFLHAWAGVGRRWALRRRCLDLYRAFPRLDDNQVTREMKRLMLRDGVEASVGGARRQQGLIQLYRGITAGCHW